MTKKIKFLPVLFLFLVIGFSCSPLMVRAQEDEELSASEVILQKQRLAKEIEDTKKTLLVQLNQYQQQEKQYRIAIDQYQRLQTLASIEEAVSSARKSMVSRNQVLKTYLNLLRLKLTEAEGIEVTHKNQALALIEAEIEDLKDFDQKLDQDLDREEINVAAQEFAPLGAQVKETSHYALSLLAIGRLQAVYDQAFAIQQKIKQKDNTGENLVQRTQRQRSLNEVDRLLEELLGQLRELWDDLEPGSYYNRENFYQVFYKNMFDDLNSIYSKLAQLVSFLEELEGVQ